MKCVVYKVTNMVAVCFVWLTGLVY